MLKKILLLGILLFIGVFVLLYFMLGRAVKLGVETIGPEITKTEVRLEKAVISPLSGKGQLEGLFVGNPEGFKLDDKIFYLGEIRIELDPKSVLSDRVGIHRIYINGPEIVYEKKLGGSNLAQLLKNIEQSAGTKKTEEPSEAHQSEITAKKIEIDEFVIEKGFVMVGMAGHWVTVPLPRIELNDIGADKGGISAQDVALEVIQALFKAVGNAVASTATTTLEKTGEAIKKAGATTNEAAQDALGKLKDLL